MAINLLFKSDDRSTLIPLTITYGQSLGLCLKIAHSQKTLKQSLGVNLKIA
jgi:hypothetical protein